MVLSVLVSLVLFTQAKLSFPEVEMKANVVLGKMTIL